MAELSLPERLVHAAEGALSGAAVDVALSPLGDKAYGYVSDFARVSASAVVDVLAESLKGQTCCSVTPDPQCLKCGQLYAEIDALRTLADQVRDVPALEGT